MYYFLEYWKKTSICKFCINLRIFLNFIILIKIFIELIEFNKCIEKYSMLIKKFGFHSQVLD